MAPADDEQRSVPKVHPGEREQRTGPIGAPAPLRAALPRGMGEPFRAVVLPPFHYAPEGCFPLDLQGEADIAPSTTVNLISFTVPNSQKCRLNGIGFGADDEVGLRFLTWQLLINGDPSQAYGSSKANIGNLSDPSTIIQSATNGQLITLSATMGAGAILPYHIVARITGWLYLETFVPGPA